MTRQIEFEALQTLFKEINQSVSNSPQDEVPIEDLFELLGTVPIASPPVELLDTHDPDIRERHVSDIEVPEYDESYGLDSSNTQLMRLESGEALTASVALLGINGNDKNNVRKYSTINAVIHSFDPDLDMPSFDEENIPDGVDLSLHQFPRETDARNKVASWVQDSSLLHSEFVHAYEQRDKITGPLFIDGPVYSGRFYWYLQHQNPSKFNRKNPIPRWEDFFTGILQKRLDTISYLHERGHPTIGVVKNPSSGSVVTSIKKCLKMANQAYDIDEFKWTTDDLFFSELLTSEMDGATIVYSPWMIEKKVTVRGKEVEPFKKYDAVDVPESFPSYKSLRRAFFYVRPPRQNYVLRVEAPYGVVENEMKREEITENILSEIAQNSGVPYAIQNADEVARIDQNTKKELKKELNASTTYNETRNYDD